MRRTVAVALIAGAFAGGVALWIAAGRAEAGAKPGESVVVFDDPSFAKSQGVVEFSHLAHKAAFGQEKLDCKPCHMTQPPPPLFPMKRTTGKVWTMAEMAQGKACGHCHDGKTTINGKTAFSVASDANCANCHKKQ